MGGEAGPGAIGTDLKMSRNRATGFTCLFGKLLDGHGGKLTRIGTGRDGTAILPGHGISRNSPDFCGTFAQNLCRIARGFNRRQSTGKGHPTAIGHIVKAQGPGIGNDRLDMMIGDAQFFGCHGTHGGAAAPYIGRAD